MSAEPGGDTACLLLCVQKQRRAGGDVGVGDDAETGNDGGTRQRSRRQTLNRVWSRPVREKPLRGPYDSPHSSDDDGDDVNTDQLDQVDRGQRLDDLEAAMSADDDDELNGDDADRLETAL